MCGLQSAGCRIVVLLASAVCSLSGDFGPGACADFLVRGTGACPLVGGLGFAPLVGRAVSRGVFRGVCVFRKTLGSLSADGWGYVLTLLVVWCEASQHWELQALEWG